MATSEATPLSDVEVARLKARRVGLFKATIAVCAVYGALALAVILIASFTTFGKEILVDKLAAFTITLLVGMSLIILFLGVSVAKYKDTVTKRALSDRYACPDFYELQETPADVLAKLPEDERDLFAYRCRPLDGIYNVPSDANKDAPALLKQSDEISKLYGGNLSSQKLFPLVGENKADIIHCYNLYPIYMDHVDNEKNKDDPTKFRCKLVNDANGCPDMSWSAVCP